MMKGEASKFIWLGPMVNTRSLANVAPASDAAIVSMQSTPLKELDNTLASLQLAVDNNFLPAFFVLASAGMALHYGDVWNVPDTGGHRVEEYRQQELH